MPHIVSVKRRHKPQLRGGHAMLTSLLLIWPWLWILWGRTLSSDLNLWCNCLIRCHTRRVGRPLAWSERFCRKTSLLPSVVYTVRLLPCAETTGSQQLPCYKPCYPISYRKFLNSSSSSGPQNYRRTLKRLIVRSPTKCTFHLKNTIRFFKTF